MCDALCSVPTSNSAIYTPGSLHDEVLGREIKRLHNPLRPLEIHRKFISSTDLLPGLAPYMIDTTFYQGYLLSGLARKAGRQAGPLLGVS